MSPELGHPCDSAFTKRAGEDVRCPPEGRTRMEWVYLLQTLSLLPGAGTHTCSDPAVTIKQPSTRPGVHKQPNLAYHLFLQNICLIETRPHSFIGMFSMTPFMLQQCACMLSHSACPTLCDPTDCSPPHSSVHGSPGKNTGVGCHSLLQGIFLTQGSNQCLLWLLHWQTDYLSLAPPGKLIVKETH